MYIFIWMYVSHSEYSDVHAVFECMSVHSDVHFAFECL